MPHCLYSLGCHPQKFYEDVCAAYGVAKQTKELISTKWIEEWIAAGEAVWHLSGIAKLIWDLTGAALATTMLASYDEFFQHYGPGGDIYDCDAKGYTPDKCITLMHDWFVSENNSASGISKERALMVAVAMLNAILKSKVTCIVGTSGGYADDRFFGVHDSNPAGQNGGRIDVAVYSSSSATPKVTLQLMDGGTAGAYNEVAGIAASKWQNAIKALEYEKDGKTVKFNCTWDKAFVKCGEKKYAVSCATPLALLFHNIVKAGDQTAYFSIIADRGADPPTIPGC